MKPNFIQRQKNLIKSYNEALREHITNYLLQSDNGQDKNSEVFERFNSLWRKKAGKLNMINGKEFPLSLNAFADAIKRLDEKPTPQVKDSSDNNAVQPAP